MALELQAVANRVEGVLLVNNVLLAQGTSAAQPQIAMSGLELPRVVGISVVVGDPIDLDQLRGQSLVTPGAVAAPGGAAPGGPDAVLARVPVPVVPEEC